MSTSKHDIYTCDIRIVPGILVAVLVLQSYVQTDVRERVVSPHDLLIP